MLSNLYSIFIWYLLAVNIAAFAAYGIDKYKAKRGMWRVKESTLLLFAFCGGGIGAWLGMQSFRHKTRHWKFRLLVPLSVIIWAALLYYIFMMQH